MRKTLQLELIGTKDELERFELILRMVRDLNKFGIAPEVALKMIMLHTNE